MSHWWNIGVPLAIILAMGVWAAPHVVGLYHQERGGRLLERALAVEGRAGAEEDPYLLLEPLASEEARRLAEQAAICFWAAIEADSGDEQTYRWLGRAEMLLGDPEGAIGAFSTFVRQRPEEPLGYWELGLAYERLAPRAEGTVRVVLGPELDEGANLAIMHDTQALTLPLSTAAIETPDAPIDTPYCERGEMPASCFVGQTAWEMPDAPEEVPAGWWVPEGPVRRAVLFV